MNCLRHDANDAVEAVWDNLLLRKARVGKLPNQGQIASCASWSRTKNYSGEPVRVRLSSDARMPSADRSAIIAAVRRAIFDGWHEDELPEVAHAAARAA